jgi:hypothetical protein
MVKLETLTGDEAYGLRCLLLIYGIHGFKSDLDQTMFPADTITEIAQEHRL